jgi:hypothetical protein
MNQNRKFAYLLGSYRLGVQIIFVFILWGVCIGVHAQGASAAQVVAGPDYKIVAQTVEKSGTLNGRTLYTLSYRYDFHSRDKIFLQEFGNIEAKGELSYLSPSKVVEFWSRDRKEKLATVEFRETAASRSGEHEEIPPLEVFLPVNGTGIQTFHQLGYELPWPINVPTQLNILKVVDKCYPTGARAWIENDTQYLETSFRPLGSLPRGIFGRVALLISFPIVPNSDPYSIEVQAAIQERLRLEDWRYDNISPATFDSAKIFVVSFARDLEKASGSQ